MEAMEFNSFVVEWRAEDDVIVDEEEDDEGDEEGAPETVEDFESCIMKKEILRNQA